MKGTAMTISLRFTGAIASAVAGEIARLEQHPDFHLSEGTAYKAGWLLQCTDAGRADRLIAGLCASFKRDCNIACMFATCPRDLRRLVGEGTAA